MLDSRGRDTAALTATTLASNETKILLEAQGADVADVFQHPTAAGPVGRRCQPRPQHLDRPRRPHQRRLCRHWQCHEG